MPSLLVQSCSATKNQVTEPTRALDVYDGYFFRIIKKAKREEAFNSDIDICILSAEYGLIDAEDTITTYDRRMTTSRAEELREEVTGAISKRIEEARYDEVVLNLGKEYLEAVDDLSDRYDVNISTVQGGGIGEKGKQLKRFVRSDTVPSVIA
ncbi:peroxide stress protein YaaA [Halorubrum distributum]|uniref:peroxide stress protein YaaA n=1 Tax=Halorubrum distributum TaxID=29283 RepID=UPI002954BBA1|nr:peroxide stress protein YaaA [Halorubrum distributum]MDV7351108.1 peroxide stress protein YaaA [Halorubrum distributum]